MLKNYLTKSASNKKFWWCM